MTEHSKFKIARSGRFDSSSKVGAAKKNGGSTLHSRGLVLKKMFKHKHAKPASMSIMFHVKVKVEVKKKKRLPRQSPAGPAGPYCPSTTTRPGAPKQKSPWAFPLTLVQGFKN